MPNPNVKITQVEEFDKYGPGPRVTPMIRVRFDVGVNGPFRVEVPKDQFTATAAWPEIDAIANQVQALHAPPASS